MPGELVLLVAVAVVAAVIGLGFGIVILAPRISRALDAADEEMHDLDP